MSLFKSRKELNKQMEALYDVDDVSEGFHYWFWKLTSICLDIFKYKGLPESLPAREIEANLIFTGHCVIFPWKDKIVTQVTNIYGYDEYYNPTKYTYAQAVMGSKSNQKIKNSVIIYNSNLKDNVLNLPCDNGLLTFIKRYARMLADIESTISIYSVNARLTSLPVATDDNTQASLQKFFDSLALGKRSIIVDQPIIDSFRNLEISKKIVNDTITDFLQARDKILEMFYRDIGVKFRNNKKGNMTEEEVESDFQVLLISLDDLLEQRKEGIKELNEKFGSKYNFEASVEINERFDINYLKGSDENDTEGVHENKEDIS